MVEQLAVNQLAAGSSPAHPAPVFRTGLILKNTLDPENVLKLLTSFYRSFRFKSCRSSENQYNLRERFEVVEMSARSFNLFEIVKSRSGTRELTISFGLLVQLARTSALQAGGRGFESHRVHNIVEEEVLY